MTDITSLYNDMPFSLSLFFFSQENAGKDHQQNVTSLYNDMPFSLHLLLLPGECRAKIIGWN